MLLFVPIYDIFTVSRDRFLQNEKHIYESTENHIPRCPYKLDNISNIIIIIIIHCGPREH